MYLSFVKALRFLSSALGAFGSIKTILLYKSVRKVSFFTSDSRNVLQNTKKKSFSGFKKENFQIIV